MNASKEINISFINAQIQDIGELATLEYLYTDAGKYSDPKQLLGIDVPFTTKSFIAKWDGSIKAGVKVEKITAEVNEEKIIEAINEICKIDMNDGVTFTIKSIAPIRKDDIYGGYCVRLEAI